MMHLFRRTALWGEWSASTHRSHLINISQSIVLCYTLFTDPLGYKARATGHQDSVLLEALLRQIPLQDRV